MVLLNEYSGLFSLIAAIASIVMPYIIYRKQKNDRKKEIKHEIEAKHEVEHDSFSFMYDKEYKKERIREVQLEKDLRS